jgi:hypothetical protein
MASSLIAVDSLPSPSWAGSVPVEQIPGCLAVIAAIQAALAARLSMAISSGFVSFLTNRSARSVPLEIWHAAPLLFSSSKSQMRQGRWWR